MDNGDLSPLFRSSFNSPDASTSSAPPENRFIGGSPLVTVDEHGEVWYESTRSSNSSNVEDQSSSFINEASRRFVHNSETYGRYGIIDQTSPSPRVSFASLNFDPLPNRSNSPRITRTASSYRYKRLSNDFRRNSILDSQLAPLAPASPTPSEEATPPRSPNLTPTPPRTPPPPMDEYYPIARPNTPVDGVDKRREQIRMNNIDVGFSWAQSWIDHVKPSRFTTEERISLPRIYQPDNKNHSIMFVAQKNVDDTLFHKFEFRFRTEKKMRQAFSKRFGVPLPFRRIRLSVSEQIEVPLFHSAIQKFESVEYVRLDTSRKNYWILYHIVNCSSSSSYGI